MCERLLEYFMLFLLTCVTFILFLREKAKALTRRIGK